MEQIKIDIVPVGVAPVAHASQFDNGRQIRFNLFNQGTPYTLTGAETVTMVVNGEEENITNTSDNYVIWDVAEEDCAEVGVIGCEIRIVLGSMLIGSKNFFLEVEMDPYDGKNIRVVTVGPADICTFETTLPEPLQSALVNVVASQASGTPTPSTPLPISGYTGMTLSVADENMVVQETHSVSWQTEAGTVYGGVLDVTRGKLHVTHGYVADMVSYNWTYDNTAKRWQAVISGMKSFATRSADILAEEWTATTSASAGDEYKCFTVGGALYCYTSDNVNKPKGELVYPLATPFDIDLTPEVISAIVGENNVFADCGQTEVEYLAEG